MSNKTILISFFVMMLASFVFLSFTEKNQADLNSKDIWFVYFDNPKDNSLNFSIENHSHSNSFHWEIFSDTTGVQSGDANIKIGETKKVDISISDTQNKKISIVVTTENNKKEIYKSF